MLYRVYISASTQAANIGVGSYGSEQDRMQFMADRVKYWLETQGKFTVIRNEAGWTLKQTVEHCNNMACKLLIDNHTNAGSIKASGAEVYYHGKAGITSNSYKLAKLLYDLTVPVNPAPDRGLHPDTYLYKSGLYMIRQTDPPATLIEHMYHTNYSDVNFYLKHVDDYARAEAKAVCSFLGVSWQEPAVPSSTGITVLVNGKQLSMKVPANMISGSVVVPARALAEALGAKVTWNDKTKTVIITQ
jgi:N-acetylmuramoyl-L-alanine amidase